MSVSRRRIRESAFIILFEKFFSDDSLEELFKIADESETVIVNDDVKDIVGGVLSHADELDEIISKYSQRRTIDRIPRVNLAILRLAVYEALYSDGVPMNVAISEAVSLAEKYAFESDAKFINGALGAFSKSKTDVNG